MQGFADKIRNISEPAKASAAYTVCSVVQNGIALITLPFFTRLLTTEQYGLVTLYSSWLALFTIFLTLNLAYGSFATAMMKYKDKRDSYIASIQGISLTLSVAFLVLYFCLRHLFDALLDMPSELVVLMVVEVAMTAATQFWLGKQRFEFKYKGVVVVTLIIAVLEPLLAFLFVALMEDKGVARILGYSSVQILIGAFFLVRNLVKGKSPVNKVFWKYALGFNIPLLAYYLSQMIFNQSDRIMIAELVNYSDAALYGVAYTVALLFIFVLNTVNASYVPWFYDKIEKDDVAANKSVSTGLSILFSFLILATIWFAPEIIFVIGGADYAPAVWVVYPVALSLLLLFYAQFSINIEFFYEKKMLLVFASVGAAALNIVLNFVAIPAFGFVAAGYTTLASYAVFALANHLASRRVTRQVAVRLDAFEWPKLVLIFVLVAALGAAGMFVYGYLVVRIIMLIALVAAGFAFRAKLMGYIKTIRNSEGQ